MLWQKHDSRRQLFGGLGVVFWIFGCTCLSTGKNRKTEDQVLVEVGDDVSSLIDGEKFAVTIDGLSLDRAFKYQYGDVTYIIAYNFPKNTKATIIMTRDPRFKSPENLSTKSNYGQVKKIFGQEAVQVPGTYHWDVKLPSGWVAAFDRGLKKSVQPLDSTLISFFYKSNYTERFFRDLGRYEACPQKKTGDSGTVEKPQQ